MQQDPHGGTVAYRLLIHGCRALRDGGVASFAFFVAALLMFLAAAHVVPAIASLQQIVLLLALVLMILAPVGADLDLPELSAPEGARQARESARTDHGLQAGVAAAGAHGRRPQRAGAP
jgi:hypothetical protein